MGRWLRHRPGGVGLRSERSGITGAMGPSMSWDPWPRPAVRVAVGTQECTQIGKNGPSTPFWAICVHCCAVGLGCGWPWDHNSVHKWEDRASPHRIGPFVYTVATRAAMRVATRAAGRCRARHRSAGLRRSAFQMNGKRLMGGSSRSCTPRRVCPIRFKALTRQSSLHTGFSALCLPAWQVA